CFFFQAEDGIRDFHVTGVQTCALPISFPQARARGGDAGDDARPRGRHQPPRRRVQGARLPHAPAARRRGAALLGRPDRAAGRAGHEGRAGHGQALPLRRGRGAAPVAGRARGAGGLRDPRGGDAGSGAPMSDMIDGLSRMALEAGQEASRNLTSAPVLAIMAERVHAGRRRRRVRATVTAGGFVAAAFAAAIVVSQLGVDPPEVEPAQTGTAIVSSVGNLTVFSDGSMSLYTQRGTFVDFPPATGPENAFAAVSGTEACSFDPGSVQIGW